MFLPRVPGFSQPMMKVAYICEPYLGGLYSFFLEMQPAFRARGVDFRCVAPHPRQHYTKGRNLDDEGVVFLPADTASEIDFVGELSRHLVEDQYRGVVVVPGNSLASTLLPSLLPPAIISIALVPHNGRGVYRPTARIRCHLDWIVAVNRRLHDDLVGSYRVDFRQVQTIFIGIDTTRFDYHPRKAEIGNLRVVFTSRLEDLQKNVLILPDILQSAVKMGGEYRLKLLCGGPDEQKLRERFRRLDVFKMVSFQTDMSRENMLQELLAADVLLMTSRFEGCPHALIEAMACGCVPVVSRLPGITDTMVADGAEGYLCRLDRPGEYACRLHELAHDPEKAARMGIAAQTRAHEEFDVRAAVAAYGKLLAAPNPGKCVEPLTLREAVRRYGRMGRRTWRSCIPAGVKKWLRTYMAKAGKSL